MLLVSVFDGGNLTWLQEQETRQKAVTGAEDAGPVIHSATNENENKMYVLDPTLLSMLPRMPFLATGPLDLPSSMRFRGDIFYGTLQVERSVPPANENAQVDPRELFGCAVFPPSKANIVPTQD